jgi:alanine dehydrogenase
MLGSSALKELSKSGVLLPQEEMLEMGKRSCRLNIGIPRETSFEESRIALTPDAVGILVNSGHNILIETNAGLNANFQDKDYSEKGAQIAYSAEDVYKSDIILKISPPTSGEIEMMRHKQVIISAIQLSNHYESVIKKLIQKKATALAFNYIKDEEGIFPVVRSMSEIAGSTAMLIAGEYLSNSSKGKGLVLGGISGVPSAEVVIIGAGTVGEFATRAALGLGASVKVFDTSIHRLRRFQVDIGRRLYTSLINPTVLAEALKNADVVIGALRAPLGRTPCVATEEMVSEMKVGSIVIDISIDQGGCFETSEVTGHSNPTYKKYGVIHYCVPNIASRVAHTASMALSNVFTPMLLQMGEEGGLSKLLHKNTGIGEGVYIYNGILTNKYLGEMYQLPYKDLNLLMAAI